MQEARTWIRASYDFIDDGRLPIAGAVARWGTLALALAGTGLATDTLHIRYLRTSTCGL
jgi:hypothetical protein